MTPCAHCSRPIDPSQCLFSDQGDMLCQRCFGTEQVNLNERHLNEEAADEAALALGVITVRGGPRPGLSVGSPAGKKAIDAGTGAGVFMILVATLWFVGGLAVDTIYFFPPVLLVIGILAVFRGVKASRAVEGERAAAEAAAVAQLGRP